ncbi:hypothetical protein Pfo_021204 [Paulownia fortunei]|nr:hypothetical protein Pfo_021204 [Paulownia fortunei]
MAACFLGELSYVKPPVKEVMKGMFIPKLSGNGATADIIALLGALVSPGQNVKTAAISKRLRRRRVGGKRSETPSLPPSRLFFLLFSFCALHRLPHSRQQPLSSSLSPSDNGCFGQDRLPAPGFVEDKKDPLFDLNSTDSTELWLIQWPINQPPDFDGQQLSLNLNGDGHLGTFEGSSEVVSFKSQGPEATVFLSSASEAKIISRRVSLIHYPEPSELQRRNNLNLSRSQRSSTATSTMSGRHLATPTRSIRPSNSQTVSGYSTPSSRNRSSLSGSGKSPKGKRVDEQSRSTDHLAQDSGKGNSAVTSTGSLEHSE